MFKITVALTPVTLLHRFSLGGKVIFHTLSFDDKLKARVKQGVLSEAWYEGHGAFLRLDIGMLLPEILASFQHDATLEKEYFFYTDTDVLFLKDITTCSFAKRPRVFSMSAETTPGRAENSGVMYVNGTALEEHREKLVAFGEQINWFAPSYDQGLLMWYMKPIPYLSEIFNWKGYWGSSDNAVIFHFHGPKPCRCLPCLLENLEAYPAYEGKCPECPSSYTALVKKYCNDTMASYQKMLDLFDSLVIEDGSPGCRTEFIKH